MGVEGPELDENGLLVNLAHSGHCRACKERVRELLTAIYGDCQVNQSFPWSSRPEDYVNTPIGDLLQRKIVEKARAIKDEAGEKYFMPSVLVASGAV